MTGRAGCPDDRGGHGEGGYVLVLVAMLLVPLLVMTAFAVDLGAWYAQGTKMQRAVDHAALAGVVWLPDEDVARSVATAVVLFNGYEKAVDSAEVEVDFPSERTLQVEVKRPAQRFFSGVVMKEDLALARSATAEIVKPVPLGSPGKILGNDVDGCDNNEPRNCPAGTQPHYFLNAAGPYSPHATADPFTTFCAGTKGPPYNEFRCGTQSNIQNPDYRDNGHEFAIDVPLSGVDKPITIKIWDAAQIMRRTRASTRDYYAERDDNGWLLQNPATPGYAYPHWVGPFDCEPGIHSNQCQTGDWGPLDRNGIATQFILYENDGSDVTVGFDNPQTADDNPHIGDRVGNVCELFIPQGTPPPLPTEAVKFPPANQPSAADDATVEKYKNKWVDMCTFTPRKPGIYPMRVKTSNITLANSWKDISGGIIPAGGAPLVPSDDRYYLESGCPSWQLNAAGDPECGAAGKPPSARYQTHNAYSLKIVTDSAATLYNLGDMPIWSNTPGAVNRLYLAEIGPHHKNKKVLVDLFDPGDGAGDFYLQLLAPPSGAPAVPPTSGTQLGLDNPIATSCRANTVASRNRGEGDMKDVRTHISDRPCAVKTSDSASGKLYDDKWLRFEVDLSPNYNCGAGADAVDPSDCWWTIKYDFGSSGNPTDGLTILVSVVGDPVHLIK